MRRLILIGIAVYLVLVVTRFPAAVAAHWFAPDGVQLHGVQGSVWNGYAQAVSIDDTRLDETRWSMRPFSLLRGRVAAEVNTSSGPSRVSALALRSLFGQRVTLATVRGIVALESLPPGTLQQPVTGRVGLDLARLVLEEDGWPVDAAGTVDLVGLIVTVMQPTEIGSFAVTFDEGDRDGGLVGTLDDVDSPLDLSGTLSLDQERVFRVDALATPRPGTHPDIIRGLEIYYEKEPGGGFRIVYEKRFGAQN